MVDESKEPFSWSKPNLTLLADYAKKKFGWTKLKFDEIMNPVWKRFTETQNQKVIDSYFKVQYVPKSIETVLSKRVQSAVQKIGNKEQQVNENLVDDEGNVSTSKAKVKKSTRKTTRVKRGKKSKDETELPVIEEAVEDEIKIDTIEEIENKNVAEASEVKNEIKSESNDAGICETSKESIAKRRQKKIIPVVDEIIPQREKDKVNALKTKLKAIEIFRKSNKGLDRVSRRKKVVKKIKEAAELSESSSD